jgi:oligoribonuclease
MALEASNLVWMDLEMTGLDPDRERIIEIAVVVTDDRLEVVSESVDLVIRQPGEILDAMDDWNREHHGRSGLVDAVRRSTLTVADAEARVLEVIAQHCPPGACPLAGNSIHVDREFLRRAMPRLYGWLHYRNVDVSTLKEVMRRWLPERFAERPKKTGDHRALGDVIDSIAELRYYRDVLFLGR